MSRIWLYAISWRVVCGWAQVTWLSASLWEEKYIVGHNRTRTHSHLSPSHTHHHNCHHRNSLWHLTNWWSWISDGIVAMCRGQFVAMSAWAAWMCSHQWGWGWIWWLSYKWHNHWQKEDQDRQGWKGWRILRSWGTEVRLNAVWSVAAVSVVDWLKGWHLQTWLVPGWGDILVCHIEVMWALGQGKSCGVGKDDVHWCSVMPETGGGLRCVTMQGPRQGWWEYYGEWKSDLQLVHWGIPWLEW